MRSSFIPSGKLHIVRFPETSSRPLAASDATIFPSELNCTKLIPSKSVGVRASTDLLHKLQRVVLALSDVWREQRQKKEDNSAESHISLWGALLDRGPGKRQNRPSTYQYFGPQVGPVL